VAIQSGSSRGCMNAVDRNVSGSVDLAVHAHAGVELDVHGIALEARLQPL
jgi:hypothetical protein